MQAAVVWEAGAPFDVRDDVTLRSPAAGEVCVRIEAAGLCRTDLSLAHGELSHPLPAVFGHEGAGIVTAVGGDVTHVRESERVVIDWIAPCAGCWACARGELHLCANRRHSSEQRAATIRVGGRDVVAGMGTATFATHTVVPGAAVVPLPADVPFAIAALLGCAVATGAGAVLKTAGVGVGDHVLVIGCGGVGLVAVQAALAAGAATVAAVDTLASRREVAERFGASALGSADEALAAARRLDSGGFDHVVDVVATPETIRLAWAASRRGGQAVIVGAGAAQATACFTAYELFHDAKRLQGSYRGSMSMRDDLDTLVGLWRSGALDLGALVTATLPLDEVNDAVERMRRGEGIRSVLVPR